jgi:hypothetical protein
MQGPPTLTEDDKASIPNASRAPVPSHITSMQSPLTPTPTEDVEASIPNASRAPIPSHVISMQSPPTPTEDVEASIPTEIEREAPNHAVAVRREAAKRTHPWDLIAGELHLVSPPPQAEDIPARKMPRLEEPLPTAIDEAETSLGLPPHPAADVDDSNADPVTNTQSNAGATRATGRWTLEKDAELTHAVANKSKKKYGKEYQTDWLAMSALVPSRTNNQCRSRWYDTLDCHIVPKTALTGKWMADEDDKLKDAVQKHDGENWNAIAHLVPGRTKKQCFNRWKYVLDPSIDRATGRMSKWTPDEDNKLKDAVRMHEGKNWDAIAHLVPDRTKIQCHSRWRDTLDPGIDRANARTGKWAADEDIKLKDAVQTHCGKNWGAIASLVPGRTRVQCCKRWTKQLDPNRSTVR